ncbi:excinuclease ABC subunit A [Shimia sp. Alg240-R146]|uniref:excinuclease ABC subunit A n=1 Tax=Shimia sp. Alg240-R146 TaxID=2993449 RepID=UPI0022E0DF19|nr:excinuclease ABC subunit A [Shimia sp. Alg240-R146]
MNHDRATACLKFASLFSAFIGLLMVAALLGAQPVMALFLDLTHLPLDGRQTFSSDSELVLGAISGGLLFGFGVMAHQVTTGVYATNPDIGGRILMRGIVSWFIVDSFGSILAGAWFNVVLNLGFLALFIVPLLAARPSFRAAS